MDYFNYMFEAGFLGTKAPFFMDVVTLIVAILPLLIYSVILLARKKYFRAHIICQNIIFAISIIVIAYFEIGVRVGGGFNEFMTETTVSYTYALIVLIVHIIIATLTLINWTVTIIKGNYNYNKGTLPGRFSSAHKLSALKTFTGIILTSFSAMWVYLLLFVY
jgi:putative membrane protein